MSFFSHYLWLEAHMPAFLDAVGVQGGASANKGLIGAHGDKCYGYKEDFERNGISFAHGVAIYLLTYCHPFSREVRQTAKGWVAPHTWVILNKDRFLPHLEPVDEADTRWHILTGKRAQA